MKPTRKPDRRPSLTLKGSEFTPEFRSLLNKAAKKRGLTQAAFVAEALERAARKVLQGAGDEEAETDAQPPAVVLERFEKTDQTLEEIKILMADQMKRLTHLEQRTLWQKLRGAFRSSL